MQEQNQEVIECGFENRSSFEERYSANLSLDRFSITHREPSLGKKITLIEAMDIQSNEKGSDIYARLLEEERINSLKRSSNISHELDAADNQNLLELTHRKTGHHYAFHECSCGDQCDEQICPCNLNPSQLCLLGLCCSKCIEKKIQYLNKIARQVQEHGCSCKNSKCLKMYCSCYSKGNKCTEKCKCDYCQNVKDNLLDLNKGKLTVHLQNQKKNQRNKHKNAKQMQNRENSHMNGVEVFEYDYTYCKCKKSHCMKKYCLCYGYGKSCNEFCTCLECYNKQGGEYDDSRSERMKHYQRFGRNNDQDLEDQEQREFSQCQKEQTDEDFNNIEKYFEEENYDNQQFYKDMEFEQVDWRHAFR